MPMELFLPILIGIVLVLAVIGWLMWKVSRKRRLPASSAAKFQDAFNRATALPNPQMRIMEADKILDNALKELGYQGSFADKLRKAGPRFSNVQSLWDAHKLRNRLAHEMGVQLRDAEVSGAMQAFGKALRELS